MARVLFRGAMIAAATAAIVWAIGEAILVAVALADGASAWCAFMAVGT